MKKLMISAAVVTVLRRFIFSVEERPIDWLNEGFGQRAEQYQGRIVQHHK